MTADNGVAGSSAANEKDRPIALFIIGPGAVGKYSVGKEIARKLGFDWALCHNHQAIEIAYEMFPADIDDGTSELDWLLVDEIREAIDGYLMRRRKNIIYTNVVRFDNPFDRSYFSEAATHLRLNGYRVCVLVLCAPLAKRLERNIMPDRLSAKPSKRNIARSTVLLMREIEEGAIEYPDIESVQDIFECEAKDICIIDTTSSSVEREAVATIEKLAIG